VVIKFPTAWWVTAFSSQRLAQHYPTIALKCLLVWILPCFGIRAPRSSPVISVNNLKQWSARRLVDLLTGVAKSYWSRDDELRLRSQPYAWRYLEWINKSTASNHSMLMGGSFPYGAKADISEATYPVFGFAIRTGILSTLQIMARKCALRIIECHHLMQWLIELRLISLWVKGQPLYSRLYWSSNGWELRTQIAPPAGWGLSIAITRSFWTASAYKQHILLRITLYSVVRELSSILREIRRALALTLQPPGLWTAFNANMKS